MNHEINLNISFVTCQRTQPLCLVVATHLMLDYKLSFSEFDPLPNFVIRLGPIFKTFFGRTDEST